jgi:hypothetical protein
MVCVDCPAEISGFRRVTVFWHPIGGEIMDENRRNGSRFLTAAAVAVAVILAAPVAVLLAVVFYLVAFLTLLRTLFTSILGRLFFIPTQTNLPAREFRAPSGVLVDR